MLSRGFWRICDYCSYQITLAQAILGHLKEPAPRVFSNTEKLCVLGVEGGALIEKGFAWGFGVGVVERALRTETVVMGDEAQLQSGNLLGCKESVHVNLHGGGASDNCRLSSTIVPIINHQQEKSSTTL